MLYRKDNPIGLDVLIDRLQKKLYTVLSGDESEESDGLWLTNIFGYPRCRINYEDGKKNIEHYIGNNEYETVLFAEDTKFFFTQEEAITPVDTEGFEAPVNLYFIIDLKEVKNNSNRDDYDCLNDVVTAIKKTDWFTINSIDTDFKSIFRNTALIDEGDNMNPYYCFMISLKSYRFETNLKKCTNEG